MAGVWLNRDDGDRVVSERSRHRIRPVARSRRGTHSHAGRDRSAAGAADHRAGGRAASSTGMRRRHRAPREGVAPLGLPGAAPHGARGRPHLGAIRPRHLLGRADTSVFRTTGAAPGSRRERPALEPGIGSANGRQNPVRRQRTHPGHRALREGSPRSRGPGDVGREPRHLASWRLGLAAAPRPCAGTGTRDWPLRTPVAGTRGRRALAPAFTPTTSPSAPFRGSDWRPNRSRRGARAVSSVARGRPSPTRPGATDTTSRAERSSLGGSEP